MKVNKFEEINESERVKGYFINSNNGELKIGNNMSSNIFLTEDEYNKIKDLADNIKKSCENYNAMKETQISRLRAAISKVKSDSEFIRTTDKFNL